MLSMYKTRNNFLSSLFAGEDVQACRLFSLAAAYICDKYSAPVLQLLFDALFSISDDYLSF